MNRHFLHWGHGRFYHSKQHWPEPHGILLFRLHGQAVNSLIPFWMVELRSPSIRPALSPANPCPTRMEHASSRLVQALNARGELGKVGRTTLQGYLASEQSALNSFWNHTSHCVNLICMLPIASNCVLLCETFGLKKVSDPYENGMVGVSPSSPSVWRHTYQQLMPHPRHLQTFKWYSPFSHSAFCISSTCPPVLQALSISCNIIAWSGFIWHLLRCCIHQPPMRTMTFKVWASNSLSIQCDLDWMHTIFKSTRTFVTFYELGNLIKANNDHLT